jgi:hypothetical protein
MAKLSHPGSVVCYLQSWEQIVQLLQTQFLPLAEEGKDLLTTPS